MGCRKLDISQNYESVLTVVGKSLTTEKLQVEHFWETKKMGVNYYPFGSIMPGRSYNSGDYRYGWNKGSEMDDEITGVTGSHYTTYFREIDTRLGRMWSRDPVFQPWQSPYNSMDNNPIAFNDPLGDEVKGKTKKDAEKTKKQMAESLGKQGEELVEKFFTIQDGNKLQYEGKDNKMADLTHYMNNTGAYRGKGAKFTKEQKAMARGYVRMIKATSFSIEVEFKEDMAIDDSEFKATGKRTGSVTIGEATPTRTYLDVNNESHFPTLTQTFVHELLGEAYIATTYGDMNTILNLMKTTNKKDWINQPTLRRIAVHIIQAENLYNVINRSGIGHGPPVHPDDVNKVNGIPEPFSR